MKKKIKKLKVIIFYIKLIPTISFHSRSQGKTKQQEKI